MPPGPNGVGKGVTSVTPGAVDEVLAVEEHAVVITGVLAELEVVVHVAGVLGVAAVGPLAVAVVVVAAVGLVDKFCSIFFLKSCTISMAGLSKHIGIH